MVSKECRKCRGRCPLLAYLNKCTILCSFCLVQAGVLRTCGRVVGAVHGFGFRPRLQGSRFTGLYKLCISGGFFAAEACCSDPQVGT